MRAWVIALGTAVGFGVADALASETERAPAPKSAAASFMATRDAPARNASTPPIALPDLSGAPDLDGRGFTGACAAARTDLCYDYREGRIVYKPTRRWMPEIDGLTPEHISVRRDRVQFHYTFR